MGATFDTQFKLFEILSNLSQYNSPDKIEELKIELRFLKEWDADNSIAIVDYGDSLTDVVNNIPGSVISYLFCFPGFTDSAIQGNINSNLRFVPVSTAFSGMDFNNSEFLNLGYFVNAYLRESNFRNANLTGADFTGADLSNAIFTDSILTDAKFHNANLCGAILTGATLPDYADTIAEFKAVVGNGNWNTSTIWTTGSNLT